MPAFELTWMPSRFGAAEYVESCIEGGVPRYTVLYSTPDGAERVAFILGRGAGAWGNSAGPPEAMSTLVVGGVPGALTEVTSIAPAFRELTWGDGDRTYSIKFYSSLITEDEIREIVASLEAW